MHEWYPSCRRRIKHTLRKLGTVSTSGTRDRSRSIVEAMDATPSGRRTNPNLLMPYKEVILPVPLCWFTIATTGVIQLRGARYDGHMCKGPCAQMCTNDTRLAVAG